MLITLDFLVKKYNLNITGILHVGAHECEEIYAYEILIPRTKILWVEAMSNKVSLCKIKFPNILIEEAAVSDKIENLTFNVSNNGQSSSLLELGTHLIMYPQIHYVNSFAVTTKVLSSIISKYDIPFNFLNLDIQGAELKAIKGMLDYLPNIDYIYSEVNSDHVYKDCALIGEIDEYLSGFGFERVEIEWAVAEKVCTWGDAFYINKKRITNSTS